MALGFSALGALFSGGDIGGAILNDLPGGAEGIFGKKPEVAPFTPVNLSDETAKAVAGNLENYPAISELLDKIIPGFSDILSTGLENTASELRGEIPQDVREAIQRSDAFQALQGGFSGTPMGRALTARDLGLTSLNLTQLGANSAQLWTQIAEGAVAPFTVSTGQQAATTAANNAGIQATEQFKNNVVAAPNPADYGHFLLDKSIGDQFMSFGLGAAGGAIAGGGSSISAAPTGSGNFLYNPATGSYTPVATSSSSATDWHTAPTWGGGGG